MRITISTFRRWFNIRHASAWRLGCFVALTYVAALISVALILPRRFYALGEPRCFDDWCVTVLNAKVADPSLHSPCPSDQDSRIWLVTVKVSSTAKEVWQRARDARAELEDERKNRHSPCAALANGARLQRRLSDEIGPGESFQILLPFKIAKSVKPEGLIVHHGDFPGIALIGADQSFLHPPALQRVVSESPRPVDSYSR